MNVIEYMKNINYDNLSSSHRLILCGSSGSGKTSLFYRLVFYFLPKFRKHIYCFQSKNTLVKLFKPILENEANIEVDIYSPDRIGEIESKYFKDDDSLFDLNNCLFFFDDISDLLLNRNKHLSNIINKLFVASRQMNCSVVLVQHKLKLFNPMVINNATKIFFTRKEDGQFPEDIEHFKKYIVDQNLNPIIINNETKQQEVLDLSSFNINKFTTQQLINRIKLLNPKVFPRLVRNNTKNQSRFVTVTLENEFGKDVFNIPISFKRLVQSTNNKEVENLLKDKIEENRTKVQKGEIQAQNDKGQSLSGSKINWGLL